VFVYSGQVKKELANATGFAELPAGFVLVDADQDGISELLFAEWDEMAATSRVYLYDM